ncbi:hypothetical protein EDEG_02872 [Edhazardia aedis USNM 41457]|uniref:Uncharacterized protein n=1 Tax=Edhazardia aedis (strain USNM 41457) TaxID=1003232 RepID=J8ZSU2_EDHAE|nr:hypothetical protein EDEG_02872 [Edhazardia aedis USNM 41457]|eukprot:EJW02733.1 hypothetical protein EDEG_02872 [Edhazardia aedis USNM 41457]
MYFFYLNENTKPLFFYFFAIIPPHFNLYLYLHKEAVNKTDIMYTARYKKYRIPLKPNIPIDDNKKNFLIKNFSKNTSNLSHIHMKNMIIYIEHENLIYSID